MMEVIPHDSQQYETVGNFFYDQNDVLRIQVSKLPNNKMELLVMAHEFFEAIITEYRGIREADITKFDVEYERKRPEGNVEEPGDDIKSPYQNEHCIATGVERLLCSLLGVNWKDYETACQECE
jgi:hypothetical protein